jgi:hypothetical protein
MLSRKGMDGFVRVYLIIGGEGSHSSRMQSFGSSKSISMGDWLETTSTIRLLLRFAPLNAVTVSFGLESSWLELVKSAPRKLILLGTCSFLISSYLFFKSLSDFSLSF